MRACVDDVYMGRVVFPAAVRQAHENADNTGVDKRGMREIDRDVAVPYGLLQRLEEPTVVVDIEFVVQEKTCVRAVLTGEASHAAAAHARFYFVTIESAKNGCRTSDYCLL